jgi:hypothetical protein
LSSAKQLRVGQLLGRRDKDDVYVGGGARKFNMESKCGSADEHEAGLGCVLAQRRECFNLTRRQ